MVIWRIDISNPDFSWGNFSESYIRQTVQPEFKNIDISTVDSFLVAKSYTAIKEEQLGSSAGTATVSGAAWDLESYQYDLSDNKIKITLSPIQTNKSLFHTFKIRQGGSDMLSLNVWNKDLPNTPNLSLIHI